MKRIGFLILALFGISSAALAQGIAAPRYQVGDSYEFASPKGNYTLVVTATEAGGVSTLSLNGDARLKIDANASVVAVKVPVNGVFEWMTIAPHGFNYQFPLVEGKMWSGSYQWALARWSGTDSVTAQVGKLTEIDFGSSKIAAIPVQYELDSRPNGAAPVKVSTTCWYAPTVGYTVKCDSTSPRFHLSLVGHVPAKVAVASTKE